MEKNKKITKKVDEQTKPIEILASPDVQKGVYSNIAVIHHTEQEFVIDFMLRLGSEGQLVSRVILSPSHMKAFSKAVLDNIKKFEEKVKKK